MNYIKEFMQKPKNKRWLLAGLIMALICAAAVYNFMKVLEVSDNFGPLAEPKDFTEESNPKQHWDLTAMYDTLGDAVKKRDLLKADIEAFGTYEGKLKNKEDFKMAIVLYESIQITVDSLNVYANLQRDAHTDDQAIDDFAQSVESLQAQMNGAFAFLDQELAGLPTAKLKDYLKLEEAKGSQWLLNQAIYQRSQVSSKRENYLLSLIEGMEAALNNPYQTFWNRFELKDQSSDYYDQYFSKNDTDRYKATKKHMEKSMEGAPLLASILENKIQYDNSLAKAYGYESSLEMVLSQDGLTQEDFDAIRETNDSHLNLMHRWITYRKNALKLKRPFALYDLQLSLTEETTDYPFEAGVAMVRSSLVPLGSEAVSLFNRAVEEQWIDVYPQEGKTDGNYTWGAYNAHPYVFLNYQDDLESVDTLAHEMGHAIHGEMTNNTQTFENASFGIYKAEIASTTSEVLFLEHAMKTLEGDALKEAQIEYVSLFANTMFEQMKATEFEIILHEAAMRGENLDDAFLVKTWRDLNLKYYGDDYELSDLDGYEWTKIDHLYWNFYMYKYATGLSSGYEIAQKLLSNDEEAQNQYLDFLKSGGSLDVQAELEGMGINLKEGHNFLSCYAKMDEILSVLEKDIE